MLCLSRKANQEIRIGKDIRIVVLKTDLGRTVLGIDAPKKLQITRPESKRQEPE